MPAAIQSALHPAGPQAARLEWLWWLTFWVSAVVFVAVVIALILAVRRGRSASPERPGETNIVRGVSIATGATIVILFGLLLINAITGRGLAALNDTSPLTIQLTGYQWWWGVEYEHQEPALRVTTANELHLPIGRTAIIKLRSTDVNHSFWVPTLHGKVDLIPGRLNTISLRADRAGVYRGQCAEFCGLQHAQMALVVVAEPADQFERWLSAQRTPAATPSAEAAARGAEIVEHGPCALCHTVRGTTAGGRTAPDLTHFASRSTIGAGAAPNTPGYLAGWLADPQHLKPGNKMPPTGLSSTELQAVLAYLETLR